MTSNTLRDRLDLVHSHPQRDVIPIDDIFVRQPFNIVPYVDWNRAAAKSFVETKARPSKSPRAEREDGSPHYIVPAFAFPKKHEPATRFLHAAAHSTAVAGSIKTPHERNENIFWWTTEWSGAVQQRNWDVAAASGGEHQHVAWKSVPIPDRVIIFEYREVSTAWVELLVKDALDLSVYRGEFIR